MRVQAGNKDEAKDLLDELLQQPGTIGYVIVNYDGIPVQYHPKETLPAVQYAALIADLVVKTKQTLGALDNQKDERSTQFNYLRLRTKQDTELVVTDYIHPGSGNEYILCVIQKSIFIAEEHENEEEAGEAK